MIYWISCNRTQSKGMAINTHDNNFATEKDKNWEVYFFSVVLHKQ